MGLCVLFVLFVVGVLCVWVGGCGFVGAWVRVCMCACVRVCVCARVRVRVRACVCVCAHVCVRVLV